MNCYNHPATAALGICKNCHKDICKTCLTDLGDGLACRGTCETEVQKINRLFRRNEKTYKVYYRRQRVLSIFWIVLGGFLISIDLLLAQKPGINVVLGGILLMIGIVSLTQFLKADAEDETTV